MKTISLILGCLLLSTVAQAQRRRGVDCEEMGRWALRHLAGSAITHPVLVGKITNLIRSGESRQFTEEDLLFAVSKRDAHSAVDIIFGLRDRAVRRYGKRGVMECISSNGYAY
jgi:hypothetical protein